MFNKVILIGRLGQNAEAKTAQNNKELLVLNGHHELVEFTLPSCNGGNEWVLLADTNQEDVGLRSTHKVGDRFAVTGRSVLVLALETENAQSGNY